MGRERKRLIGGSLKNKGKTRECRDDGKKGEKNKQ